MTIYYPGSGHFRSYAGFKEETFPTCRLKGKVYHVDTNDKQYQKWQVQNEKGEMMEFFLLQPYKCPKGALCAGGNSGETFDKIPKTGTEIDLLLYADRGVTKVYKLRKDDEGNEDKTLLLQTPYCEASIPFSPKGAIQAFWHYTAYTACRNPIEDYGCKMFSYGVPGILIVLSIFFFFFLFWILKKFFSKKNTKSSL